MNANRIWFGALCLPAACAGLAYAQINPASRPVSPPPKVLLLVHQQFQFGKAPAREKLDASISRAFDRLNVPVYWIDLQSITGPPEALFFDPADSFEALEKAGVVLGEINAAHPDLARMQDDIRAMLASEKTVIAVRRDDLGYRAGEIDIAKARHMRVNRFHVRPGLDSDFAEVAKIRAAAYEKAHANIPWVVYQVNAGTDGPTFLVFLAMRSLKELDELPAVGKAIQDAQGEEASKRLDQLEQQAFTKAESQLYAISPQMSHVPKEFAAVNPDFWSPKTAAVAKEEPKAKTRKKE